MPKWSRSLRRVAAVAAVAVLPLSTLAVSAEAAVTNTGTGTVIAGSTSSFKSHPFSVPSPTTITATLTWTGGGELNLLLRDPSAKQIAASTKRGVTTQTVTAPVTITGTYSLAVQAVSGRGDYTFSIDQSPVGAVKGIVWNDDGDGVRAAGETGRAGVALALLDATGTQNATTTTTSTGAYSFAGVAPGSWTVRLTPPNGTRFGPRDAGTSDAADSDFDPATASASVDVSPGVTATADAALFVPAPPAGSVSYQKTFGYSGPAGTYPYGMEWDATSNTLVVGDYWNTRVKRYTTDGQLLSSNLSKKAPRGQNGGICVPYDVDVDTAGNIWVADQNCNRVVAFDKNGNWLRTIGNGGSPSYGQGCGGGKMQIPTNVLVHPATNEVWASDPRCNQVYLYSNSGTFIKELDWTASGLTKRAPRGLDSDAAGNVYVVENFAKVVVVFDRDGNYLRKFSAPIDMNDPRGLSISKSDGLVYIVAAYHNELFKFSTDGRLLGRTKKAGDTPFNSVRYPAADESGNVWVGDTFGFRTWHLGSDFSVRTWSTPAEPPPHGGYNQNNGVAVSPTGKLYVIDTYDQHVQRFDTAGASCLTRTNCPSWELEFGGRQPAGLESTGFGYPRGLAWGAGHIWVGDNNNAVLQFTADGTFVNRFGQQGPGVGMFRGGVQGIYVSDSKVYATDVLNCRLQTFTLTGTLVKSMGSCGSAAGQMQQPRGVAVDEASDTAYVVDTVNNRLAVWNASTGVFLRNMPLTCAGVRLNQPYDVELDASKTWLYVTDVTNKRVVRASPDGSVCEVASTGSDTPERTFAAPRYLAFDPAGRLYVSDGSRHVYAMRVN